MAGAHIGCHADELRACHHPNTMPFRALHPTATRGEASSPGQVHGHVLAGAPLEGHGEAQADLCRDLLLLGSRRGGVEVLPMATAIQGELGSNRASASLLGIQYESYCTVAAMWE